jgi:hypothetical protein
MLLAEFLGSTGNPLVLSPSPCEGDPGSDG